MENLYFEVDFEKYCKTCEHKDLDHGSNTQSEKPVNWKEKTQ